MIMLAIYVFLGGKEYRFFRNMQRMERWLMMTGKWMRYAVLRDCREHGECKSVDDLVSTNMSFYG